jgi:hydroxymethylpyrimidine/phosphomethylpyrimidine kinase
LKYSEKNIDKCKKAGFMIGKFDRVNEPRDVKSTMEWGTFQVIKTLGFVPDVIYDTGGIGKEPMIRIIGLNPEDVIKKVKKIVIV